MNVAIISFQKNTDFIGAKYLHAFLRKNGLKSYLIFNPTVTAKSDDALIDFIEKEKIEVVGLSIMSEEFFRASTFAKELKRRLPKVLLVFGGIHATIAPEECLENGDVAVAGEGEHAFLELLRDIKEKKDYSRNPGICVLKDGEVLRNAPSPLHKGLDDFPFPGHLPQDMFAVIGSKVLSVDNKIFKMFARYSGMMPNIVTTRGCPFSCTYCCNSAYKELYGSTPIRKRSVDSVIEECLKEKTEHPGIVTINFQDDCFMANTPKWIDEFSEKYKRLIDVPFIIRTTPLHITEKKIAALKKAGVIWVLMGLQTGSEKINKEIYNRNVSNEVFLKATRILLDYKICGSYDVILDNPYETEEDTMETLKVLLSIPKPFHFLLFSLCLYQGTEIYTRIIEDGVDFVDPRLKGYNDLRPSIQNKLIRMVPTYPNRVVRFFIRNRNNRAVKGMINICDRLNTVLLEQLNMLKMMHRSYGSNPLRTIRLLNIFFSTAIKKYKRVPE
jgi:radical SAM superfamily enzyme YgiQ (UPF0313 family)